MDQLSLTQLLLTNHLISEKRVVVLHNARREQVTWAVQTKVM